MKGKGERALTLAEYIQQGEGQNRVAFFHLVSAILRIEESDEIQTVKIGRTDLLTV